MQPLSSSISYIGIIIKPHCAKADFEGLARAFENNPNVNCMEPSSF